MSRPPNTAVRLRPAARDATPLRRFLSLSVGPLAGVWVLMLAAAPYLVSHDHTQGSVGLASAAVYVAGGVVCHQQSARSFHPWGTQMPVCARCSGLYALAPFGILLARGRGWHRADSATRAAWTGRSRWSTGLLRIVLLVTAVPTLVTVGGELMGLMHPTNLVRAVLAVPLGGSVAWVVGLALSGAVHEAR